MNIFMLDKDPVKAAQYHCDKHVVKMILETGQLFAIIGTLILISVIICHFWLSNFIEP